MRNPFSSVEKYFFYEQKPSVVSIFINNFGKGESWACLRYLWKIEEGGSTIVETTEPKK